MFLTLGKQFGIDDRGARGQVGGWGVPGWGPNRARSLAGVGPGYKGVTKPRKVGARYFCDDCNSKKDNTPVAGYNVWTGAKEAYQEDVLRHMSIEHPDLHWPPDENKRRAKTAAAKLRARTQNDQFQKAMIKWAKEGSYVVGGGGDFSGGYHPVTRPRELADFTEFDHPDATLTDTNTEEIELDQLISIAARQGRRLLGVELQQIANEFAVEFLTVGLADHAMTYDVQLNTRTGTHNLDDPENLWRKTWNQISPVITTVGSLTALFEEENDIPPGGVVYVAPRLFYRQENNIDATIATGALFTRIATIAQPLSTFLLFELLEQFSGLFGFAA